MFESVGQDQLILYLSQYKGLLTCRPRGQSWPTVLSYSSLYNTKGGPLEPGQTPDTAD